MTDTLVSSPAAPAPERPWRRRPGEDRCDRCRAEAFARVTVSGTDLFFCGHHFTEHEPALVIVAEQVVDRRDLINAKPSQSASL